MKDQVIRMKSTTNPARSGFISFNTEEMGAYLKKVNSYKSLDSAEEKEIARKAKNGDKEAKKILVQSNLKLVLTIARKAIHVSKLPMVDLIQEGNLGLMIAVEKFNPDLGYRFSTYASWLIKQAMFKAISEQSHCMKIPVYIQETLSKFSKVKAEMERAYNCQVTNKDVAQKEINRQWMESDGLVNYLGEWHTHAQVNPKPSIVDLSLLRQIIKDHSSLWPHLLMLILGQAGSAILIVVEQKRKRRMQFKVEVNISNAGVSNR